MAHFVDRVRTMAFVVLTLLLVVAAGPAAARNSNPQVIPPQANAHGRTYGEWATKWWSWAFQQAFVPVNDPDGSHCADGQRGKVWFLAGTSEGSATRECTIPSGTALFFPLANVADVFDPQIPQTDAELIAECDSWADTFTHLFATIDGRQLKNLTDYRVETLIFQVPQDFPDVGGNQAASCGYYLFLAPLSKGEHTLRFGGDLAVFGLHVEVTYHLTVGK
jgi:hypothetical protein